MMKSPLVTFDPKLDLAIERIIDVPRELVWKAWTMPEHLRHWFTPKPWFVAECEVDLRPGGTFRTLMRSPEGEESLINGCYLEVIPNERLVWTDALLPGFRPSTNPFITGVLLLEPHGKGGTRYTAMAIHRDQETRDNHEKMGFYDGWGTVTDQMIELIKAM